MNNPPGWWDDDDYDDCADERYDRMKDDALDNDDDMWDREW